MKNDYKARLIAYFILIFNIIPTFAKDVDKCLKEKTACAELVRTSPGDPQLGDIYRNSIVINNKMQIMLPEGLWEVNALGDYKGDPRWHAPWYYITLINLDKSSPIKFAFYDYFKSYSTWNGWDTPCDNPKNYPGINIIEKKNVGVLDKCIFGFHWSSTSSEINFVKTNTWWKNEIKNLSNDFVNKLPGNAFVFQSLIKKTNASYIREVLFVDVYELDIYPSILSSIIQKKYLTASFDKSTVNEELFMSWFTGYSNLFKDVFFEGKAIDPAKVHIPIKTKTMIAAEKLQTEQLVEKPDTNNPSPSANPTSANPTSTIANSEAPSKEALEKEAALKEAAFKEAVAREVAIREAAMKEAAAKEAAIKEAAIKEAASKELAIKEAAAKEAAIKEAATREAAAKEAAIKEAAIKEAAAREAAARESAIKEAAAREAALKVAQKEAAAREAALRAAQKETAIAEVNPHKKALVLGNDKYQNIPPLKNAKSDAEAIGVALRSVGYKVLVKTDLNQKDMKTVLRQFKLDVEGGDEVVLFYAGHGIQIGGSNYLLPTDISAESEEQIKDDAIQLQRLLDDMNEKKVRITLALIDACRDNPFPKSGRAVGGRGLAPTSAATGQMIIFSAGSGQQALDRLGSNDKDPNSLFTRILIKEIATPGVRVDNVVREVRKKVVEAAKSIGHEQVPAIYDQVVGDFYFIK